MDTPMLSRRASLSVPHLMLLTLSQHPLGLKGDSFKEITSTVPVLRHPPHPHSAQKLLVPPEPHLDINCVTV